MADRQIRVLTDLETEEVSIVDRGANRKTFAIAKAEWSQAQINDLPDASFLYVEAGGEKDESGKTTPRRLRHFPIRNAAGQLDLPHLRNAIARIPQSRIPGMTEADRANLQEKARGILRDATGDTRKMKLAEVMRTVIETPAEGEEKITKGIENEKGQEAVLALYRIAKAFEGEIPEGFSIMRAEKAEPMEDEEDKPSEDMPTKGEGKDDMKKEDGGTPATEDLRKSFEDLRKAHEEASARAEALQKALDEEREIRVKKEFDEKAREIGAVPGKSTEEISAMLLKAHTVDPEMAKDLEDTFKKAAEALEKGALLEEVGTSRAAPGGDAWNQIEKAAKDLVAKAEGLTESAAVARVLETRPDLYDAYLAEQRR